MSLEKSGVFEGEITLLAENGLQAYWDPKESQLDLVVGDEEAWVTISLPELRKMVRVLQKLGVLE